MLRVFALACMFVFTPVIATAGNVSPAPISAGHASLCKIEYRKSATGIVVAAVNCGLSQTCEDGKTCCRLGASVSCCDSTEKCNQGMCEPK